MRDVYVRSNNGQDLVYKDREISSYPKKKSKKEKVDVYVPKTLDEAKKVFEMFKELNIEKLDGELFLEMFTKGEGEIGFGVRNNTWQIFSLIPDKFYDINIIPIP